MESPLIHNKNFGLKTNGNWEFLLKFEFENLN